MGTSNFNGIPYGASLGDEADAKGITPSQFTAQGAESTDAALGAAGGAGIGAAGAAASAILNAIAAQNTLDFKHHESQLDRNSTASMNSLDRDTAAHSTGLAAQRAANNDQMQARGTQISAISGSRGLNDNAISSMADRIAKLYAR